MKELIITPIKNGTVIDHISPGNALKVLHVLGIPASSSSIVSVAMNVRSKMGKKDIVKISKRFLDEETVNRIALIAPKASLNIIKKGNVVVYAYRDALAGNRVEGERFRAVHIAADIH